MHHCYDLEANYTLPT